jgi:uncharacterized protein YjiS (DUF1127 family)
MRNAPRDGRGDNAQAQLAREYPSVVLILDTCFRLCTAIADAWRHRRTQRVLAALDRHLLRDIGFTPEDLRNGRLDRVLKKQQAAARPRRAWAHVWRAAFATDRSRKALVALGADQLHSLSEQGLKTRREALHDHHSGCTCRTTGAHP